MKNIHSILLLSLLLVGGCSQIPKSDEPSTSEASHQLSSESPSREILQPRSKKELEAMIKAAIAEQGNAANLNHIDTSRVTDMSFMFYGSQFNGDISKWDVSKVKNMTFMFQLSAFNGDISQWDMTNVTDMFHGSPFNGDN